jgi:glycosyltransferase involved in cell wall biosynthesis
MTRPFEFDPHPGRPKILFVGSSLSTHTHSWIDLLEDARMNVRLFSLDDGSPPSDWPVKTYLTHPGDKASRSSVQRRSFFTLSAPRKSVVGMAVRAAKLFKFRRPSWGSALADVIRAWRPDVIHTLGLDCASYDYLKARQVFDLNIGKWVVQVRGGPDLYLNQHIPRHLESIRAVIAQCDQLIADNQQNYDLLATMGVPAHRRSPLGVVPGSGGIDVPSLSRQWPALPSQRSRLIVWPKTYEAPSSKALPVFEAIRIAWPRIRPCRIHLLWVVQPEVRAWFAKLPQEIQESCTLHDRIPRAKTLDLFLQARVMLAPSLTDGIPNSMLEAMACGAFPIVSPIDTLAPLIKSPDHTIFARNLYPDELAQALDRAMNDDALVDAAAQRNLEFVSRQSNRAEIRPRVIQYYEDLAAGNCGTRKEQNVTSWDCKEKSAA